MPPPTSQDQDPRSPRPFPPRQGPLPAYLTSTVDTPSSSDSSLNSNLSARFTQLSRRLRDDRARANQARDIDASFRQRLRSLHAARTSSTLPDLPDSMLQSRQRFRDRIVERLEEQNRTRLQQARADAAERAAVRAESFASRIPPRPGPNPRRRRRPSYSLLRPANVEAMSAETAASEARRVMERSQRPMSARYRRAHIMADRQNSPFTLGRAERTYLSDTVTDSDADVRDSRDSRPNHKRRKLSHDDGLFDGYDPVRYGWNGQVEPGHLRLEIVSCDGGQYDQTLKFRAENVLRNDKSVYCSNSSVCSFLFRHQAETSFNLDALVIKGPESGYTSPVQQGLIFVGMSMDDLLRSAAAYQMTYPSSHSSENPLNERELNDLIEDHSVYLNSQNRDPSRFSEDMSRSEQHHSYTVEGVDCDFPMLNSILSSNQLAAAPSPPYSDQAMNELSDNDGDSIDFEPRGPTRTTVYSYGNHTVIASGNGQPTSAPPAHGDDDDGLLGYWEGYECPESHHRMTPGRIEKIIPPGRKDSEILSPNATFFIRRSQNRITIKFEPSLAGRYVLLKLFNPNRQNENIDVQFVSAYGFSGPRFVPALELR